MAHNKMLKQSIDILENYNKSLIVDREVQKQKKEELKLILEKVQEIYNQAVNDHKKIEEEQKQVAEEFTKFKTSSDETIRILSESIRKNELHLTDQEEQNIQQLKILDACQNNKISIEMNQNEDTQILIYFDSSLNFEGINENILDDSIELNLFFSNLDSIHFMHETVKLSQQVSMRRSQIIKDNEIELIYH